MEKIIQYEVALESAHAEIARLKAQIEEQSKSLLILEIMDENLKAAQAKLGRAVATLANVKKCFGVDLSMMPTLEVAVDAILADHDSAAAGEARAELVTLYRAVVAYRRTGHGLAAITDASDAVAARFGEDLYADGNSPVPENLATPHSERVCMCEVTPCPCDCHIVDARRNGGQPKPYQWCKTPGSGKDSCEVSGLCMSCNGTGRGDS